MGNHTYIDEKHVCTLVADKDGMVKGACVIDPCLTNNSIQCAAEFVGVAVSWTRMLALGAPDTGAHSMSSDY